MQPSVPKITESNDIVPKKIFPNDLIFKEKRCARPKVARRMRRGKHRAFGGRTITLTVIAIFTVSYLDFYRLFVDMIANDIGGAISDNGMADKKDFPAVDIEPNPAFGSFLRNFQLRQQTLPNQCSGYSSVTFATEHSVAFTIREGPMTSDLVSPREGKFLGRRRV